MLKHRYPFDPTYNYTLDQLLDIEPPAIPSDFASFWESRYATAIAQSPNPTVSSSELEHPDFKIEEISFRSTDDVVIHSWLLTPFHTSPRQAFVMGHGYGGIEKPSFDLPFKDAVYAFPSFRGLGRSQQPWVSSDPNQYVLHNIDHRDRYILGGCVDDLWQTVSAVIELFPELSDKLNYIGISFGGGIGALAMPWDKRIKHAHLNVPSFGHHPLRLTLPTNGSGEAVRKYHQTHGYVLETLKYYDAADAATFMTRPVHIAAALFDPVVAPPGQFAIHNALPVEKQLFVRDAGHHPYRGIKKQHLQLNEELKRFFQ